VKAREVTAGPAESNGSLLRDSLHVTYGLNACKCTPGSAPGPAMGNEYGKTLPFTVKSMKSKIDLLKFIKSSMHRQLVSTLSLNFLTIVTPENSVEKRWG